MVGMQVGGCQSTGHHPLDVSLAQYLPRKTRGPEDGGNIAHYTNGLQ